MAKDEIKEISKWLDELKTLLDVFNERMKAALAEAEKPKLRHGDYGVAPEGAWTRVHGSTWWNLRPSAGPSQQDADTFLPFRLGNIFDDLKAMAEPLEEFGEGGLLFQLDSSGGLNIDTPSLNTRHLFYVKDLPGHILKLRRLQHAAEQEQND